MDIVDIFFNGNLLSIFIKLFGVVLSLLYLFFSIIMIKQVENMKKTVVIDDGGTLKILAYVQAAMAAFILFYAVFIL